MTSFKNNAVICRLKEMRTRKRLTQIQLAEQVGLKRQAIYDIENGRYLPNTGVALKLAKCLDCRVEDIFFEAASDEYRPVSLIAGSREGNRVTLVKVRDSLIGYPLDKGISTSQGIQSADGLLASGGKGVKLLCEGEDLEKSILLLGCDPAFNMLSSYIQQMPGKERLHWRFASSCRAIEYLAAGQAHIAGIHLHKPESNLDLARRNLTGSKNRLVAFSVFEEGLMVAPGNPLDIRGIADLAREDVRLANREPGAALRILLDELLKRNGIPPDAVRGYDNLVHSHVEGAQQVMFKTADAALGLQAVSASCGLDFVPIASVRCDLVIPADMFDLPAVRMLMDILQTRRFRDELASLPGYEAAAAGSEIAEI